MPKVRAKVLNTRKDEQGRLLAQLQFNNKIPSSGEIVSVKWGAVRSLAQNAFLWKYYSWLIEDAGLKEQGFFCPEALHASLKAKFLADKIMSKGEWKIIEEGSSATLSKSEFSSYMEKVDNFVCEFFEISTAPFFEEYQNIYKPEWKQ